jgi:predicted metal-binding protein
MIHSVTICRACLGGPDLVQALSQALTTDFHITQTDCMSGCARAATVAFRAPGKMAYLFGDLTVADVPDLVTFARLYLTSADGTFADARPLGTLRTKAIARIPA